MARVEHAVAAIVLLVAFVADLRFVVPIVALLLVVHTALSKDRTLGIEAGLLTLSALCFLLGNEIAAWTLALSAAIVCGLAVASPRHRVDA